MTMSRAILVILLLTGTAAAQTPLAPRDVPAHTVPVPDTVSPEFQKLIAAPYNPVWTAAPATAEAWHQLVDPMAAEAAKALPALRDKLRVRSEPVTIDGVKAYMITPIDLPPANRNRLLVHVHGGAYTLFPGESGTREAIALAGIGRFRVLSVDYRMPPDFPYPAAMDDAMTVWRAALKMAKPSQLGIFGTSTGGGMTLAMVLRAKQEGLKLPAAIAPGTPWSDLTKTGDSYYANAMLDNVLVAYEGFLEASAKIYANGHDLKDPLLSPIYGDLHGFPPTILTSGTRDLFLSNTVRVHRKLRQAGVEAVLQVYEGMSHAAYNRDPFAPENHEVFEEIARFFDKHLAK
jgi:monoterpene epsilon-lactone hydrolase